MPTPLSISETIQVGKVCTYLSANQTDVNVLFGGNILRPIPPILIPMVTDALSWANSGANNLTATQLRALANYAYWCYDGFIFDAINVISGPGGGTVIPIPSGQVPNPLDFIVDGSSVIATGESSVVLTDFIGYNIEFVRGSAVQYTTNPGDGSTYYNWNKVTGLFSLLNGSAFEGERFRIVAVL